MRDSDRVTLACSIPNAKAERGERMEKHLLITRYDSARAERGDMLKVDDVLEILFDPVDRHHSRELGCPACFQRRRAVTLADARCAPAMAYFDAARRLSGEDIPLVIPGEKRAFLQDLRKEGRMSPSIFPQTKVGAARA